MFACMRVYEILRSDGMTILSTSEFIFLLFSCLSITILLDLCWKVLNGYTNIDF